MKLTYLLTGWGHTGGSLVLYNFMDKLCERGYTVHAATPSESVSWRPGYSRELTNRFAAKGKLGWAKRIAKRALPVERLRKFRARPQVSDLYAITEGLVRHWVEADITVATAWETSWAAFALGERTTSVYHMQHWEELFFHDEFSRGMARLTYRLPISLISNSSWLRQEVRRRVHRDSWLLLPGTDVQMFYPRISISEKFAKFRKVRVVCYYSPRDFKGWPDAEAAMRHVFAEAGKDRLEWFVYGGRPVVTPDVPVTFVGAVFGNALAELYSSAHIVFMPSWYESFPLPPIEAMASGAAAVVTGTGTEDYAIDGQNALVRPANAPDVLASAILELIQNPSKAAALAEAGVETARELDWNVAADQLERILADIVVHNDPPRCIPPTNTMTEWFRRE